MTLLRIAEVAERTGVPATTLRYYEEIGLLAPAGRTGNGYRAYTGRDVDRLRFLTRAKQLDLSLADLRELLTAWDGDDCEGVQERMARVVADRIGQTSARIADLMELAAQLQTAAARLAGTPPHPGGCDDECACANAATPAGAGAPAGTAVPAGTAGPGPADPVPTAVPLTADGSLACTLDQGAMSGRVGDWQAVLARATGWEAIPGGAALSFPAGVPLTAELARLAAAEHACCSFFDFGLAVTSAGVRFEVRAPAEAQHLVAALFGPGVVSGRSPSGSGGSPAGPPRP
jgi:DNA-binding transcriptional MerR regulator